MPSIEPPHRGHPSIPATPSNTPASRTSNTPSSSATPASHTPAPTATPASHTPAPHHQQQPQQLPHITSEMLNTALQSVLGGGGAIAGKRGNVVYIN